VVLLVAAVQSGRDVPIVVMVDALQDSIPN
jgi:hypothetical protein